MDEDKARKILAATKAKMDQGLQIFLHIVKHENVASLRKLVYSYLLHVKERLAPLFKLATWVEVWKHPLTRRARAFAAKAAKLIRLAMREVFRNLLVLLSEANKLAKKAAAEKLTEAQERRTYDDLEATILSGLAASPSERIEDAEDEEGEAHTSLPPRASVDESSPVPLESEPSFRLGIKSISPKEDIKSLCNTSVDLIDLNSDLSQYQCQSPKVPRMWQSYNPEDIKTCAKSTPACRTKYVERSPNTWSDSESMATAQSSHQTEEEREDGHSGMHTPESVNIDMAVYSTGTPFKETLQNIQDQCQTLDFAKVESARTSPSPNAKAQRGLRAVGDLEDQENRAGASLPVPFL